MPGGFAMPCSPCLASPLKRTNGSLNKWWNLLRLEPELPRGPLLLFFSLLPWLHQHFLPFQLAREARKWEGNEQDASLANNAQKPTLHDPRATPGSKLAFTILTDHPMSMVFRYEAGGVFLSTHLFPSDTILFKFSISVCITILNDFSISVQIYSLALAIYHDS